MTETVIVSGARTPIDDFGGALKETSALELGKTVIAEAIRRAGLSKEDIDEVTMGNVLPGGLGQNPARQAMLMAGLPVKVGALTINKVCGSGLKAAMLSEQVIRGGDAEIIVAGGMENMYLAPYYLPRARDGYRMSDGKIIDGMIHDGLWDILGDLHMGRATENVAERYRVSRLEQDEFACRSYALAQKAWATGRFKEEVVPVEIPQRKGPPRIFDRDEACQRQTSMEALGKLPPAFKENGTVTAGNSSKISAGAAALVLMSAETAKRRGIKPLARIIAHGAAGIDVAIPTAAPINSIPKVLKKAGLQEKDIDLHEINEAFAASTLAVIKELHIDPNKVNINGGAIALGHPIGCSGARILITLINNLKQRDLKRGMASVCLGGAEAVSMIIERL
ncbi:MAG: acetyl-CoA C-acetyltransferase [Chloroflexi bacterium]|nr:acetyl-CoA C-acetyltransferase [Chloroflexota bacterium]